MAFLFMGASVVVSMVIPLVIFGISRLLCEVAMDLKASADQVTSAAAQVSS